MPKGKHFVHPCLCNGKVKTFSYNKKQLGFGSSRKRNTYCTKVTPFMLLMINK